MPSIAVYKSYNFVNKDPVIDKVRTILRDEGETLAEVHRRSGVNVGTITNWLSGPTRRPQYASVAAVLRSLGYDFEVVKKVLPLRRRISNNQLAKTRRTA